MTTGGKIDLRHILQLARRRKWFLIIPPVVALGFGIFQISRMVPLYQSTTTIFIDPNLEFHAELGDRLGIKDEKRPQMRNEEENIRKQLLSTQVLGEIIDRVKLKPSGSMLEQVAQTKKENQNADVGDLVRHLQMEWLRNRLVDNITFPKRGSYVEIAFIHSDPELAFQIVKHMADVFIEQSVLNDRLPLEGTMMFSEEKLEGYREKYETAMARLRAYQVRIARDESRNLTVNVNNAEKVRAYINSLNLDLSRKQREVKELEAESGLPISQLNIAEDAVTNELDQIMREKAVRLAELMTRLSWKDAEVIKVNQDLADLRDQYKTKISQIANTSLAGYLDERQIDLSIKRQVAMLDVELLTLEQSELDNFLSVYRLKKESQPWQQVEVAALEREAERLGNILNAFKEQAEGTRLKDDLTRSDVNIRYRIIDPATKPVAPIKDDPNRIIMLATLGGVGCGVGFVYALEFFDHSFKSVDEVESFLGLTVLGTVPKIAAIEHLQSDRSGS